MEQQRKIKVLQCKMQNAKQDAKTTQNLHTKCKQTLKPQNVKEKDTKLQATEPYNNEESASRDEGGNALAEISADDNIYDIVNISNDDNVSDDDNFEEALAGEMVPVKSTDEMKIHEIQSTVVNSNNKTEAGSKVEGVNSKKAMASNSLSQTISTTDSLVEIESLRTQVSVFNSPALWFF